MEHGALFYPTEGSEVNRLNGRFRSTTLKGLVVVVASAVVAAACSKPPAKTEERYSRLPTATEVFNLRTKCAQLARDLDESFPYGLHWQRDTVSNYSAKSNRCYVTLIDSNDVEKEYSRNLYDGQTRDLLAYTKTEGEPCCRRNQVGMIFIDNNLDTSQIATKAAIAVIAKSADSSMKR